VTRVLRLIERGAGIRRPALVVAPVLLCGLLSGCAVGGADEPEAYDAPRPSLAEKGDVAAKNKKAERQRTGDRTDRRKRTSDNGTGDTGAVGTSVGATGVSSDSEPPAKGGVTWTALAADSDEAGDHGDGPAYADLTHLDLAGTDQQLRIDVEVAGTVLGALADREVEGVGIDLFRSDDVESDYQVFLDGGAHGWRAFLQTPDGFVKFPGTFAVTGRHLVVTLPWSAVGGREDADVSAFIDWSSGTRRLSTDGTDKLPLQPD